MWLEGNPPPPSCVLLLHCYTVDTVNCHDKWKGERNVDRVEELIEKLMQYSSNSMKLFQENIIDQEEMERRVSSVHLQLMELNKSGVNV